MGKELILAILFIVGIILAHVFLPEKAGIVSAGLFTVLLALAVER